MLHIQACFPRMRQLLPCIIFSNSPLSGAIQGFEVGQAGNIEWKPGVFDRTSFFSVGLTKHKCPTDAKLNQGLDVRAFQEGLTVSGGSMLYLGVDQQENILHILGYLVATSAI